MKIYIDNNYKCHVTNDGAMQEHEVPFFDNKCAAFIEGYRYIPKGEIWVRSDGIEFTGEMISPHVDYQELKEAQLIYEKE